MRKTIQATLVLIALGHGLAASAGESYQQSMAQSEAIPIQNEYYGGTTQTTNNFTSNSANYPGPDGAASNLPNIRQANGVMTDVDKARGNAGVVPGGYLRHEVKMEVRTYR